MARVAEILAPRYPDATADELRSIAFGWLARPAELLAAAARAPRRPGDPRPRAGRRAGRRGRGAVPGHRVPGRPARRAPRGRPVAAGTQGGPLRPPPRGRRRTAPTGRRPGRGSGPVTLTGLQPCWRGPHLVVKPVLDLSDRVRSTAYEHPESLKERVHLTTGGDYWPYATSTSRRSTTTTPPPTTPTAHPARPAPTTPAPWAADTTAGRPTPATAPDNAAPVRYVWLTPHGLGYLVDHHGTRRISNKHARMILEPHPGSHLPRLGWRGADPRLRPGTAPARGPDPSVAAGRDRRDPPWRRDPPRPALRQPPVDAGHRDRRPRRGARGVRGPRGPGGDRCRDPGGPAGHDQRG